MSHDAERCLTCSDEAVAARVRAVDGLTAEVVVDGRIDRVERQSASHVPDRQVPLLAGL